MVRDSDPGIHLYFFITIPISEKCGSPVTTTACISWAVDAIMASAIEMPGFLIDPADRAIEIVTGIIGISASDFLVNPSESSLHTLHLSPVSGNY